MKKRLRKKLGMGEYRELGFELSGNLIEMDEEQGDAVFQRFVTSMCGVCACPLFDMKSLTWYTNPIACETKFILQRRLPYVSYFQKRCG